MAGISEFCAKIMIQYADKDNFLVAYGYQKFKVISSKTFFIPIQSYPFLLKVIF